MRMTLSCAHLAGTRWAVPWLLCQRFSGSGQPESSTGSPARTSDRRTLTMAESTAVSGPTTWHESRLKHVVESQQFTVPLLMGLFDRSRGMERIVARGGSLDYQNRIMATLFYAPSTRTRFSFEAAMQSRSSMVAKRWTACAAKSPYGMGWRTATGCRACLRRSAATSRETGLFPHPVGTAQTEITGSREAIWVCSAPRNQRRLPRSEVRDASGFGGRYHCRRRRRHRPSNPRSKSSRSFSSMIGIPSAYKRPDSTGG
jgi:hypothetical protein